MVAYVNCQQLVNTLRYRYALDISRAIRYLHDARIVHLDLKPANVIVTLADVCKLGDFGCCQVNDASLSVSQLNRVSVFSVTIQKYRSVIGKPYRHRKHSNFSYRTNVH